MRKAILVSVGLLALAASAVPSWSADVPKSDLCAVSGTNGKLALEGGAWDENDYGNNTLLDGVATLTMPLGCALGLQIDAGAGTFGDADAVGVGGHLFMRDPTSYLLGVHGTYENWNFDAPSDDVGVVRVGVEAEAYLGNISLEAWAGIQDTDKSSAEGFAKLTAAFYATDDLRFSAGLNQAGNFSTGVIGAEWQLTDMPLSLTATAEFGEDDYRAIMGGVRFYFGGTQKALIDRHRQDDPADGLFNFTGATASEACGGGGSMAPGFGAREEIPPAPTGCNPPPTCQTAPNGSLGNICVNPPK